MARAEIIPADYTLHLTLSRDEAEALRALVANSAGIRQFAAIYLALVDAGVEKKDTF